MKANWITCGMVAGMLVLMQTAPTLGEEATFRLGIGIGIMASPGGNSYMKDHGGDAQELFFDLVVSGKIRVSDNWAVIPAIELSSPPDLMNAEIGLSVPSLNVRYSFTQEPSFYVQAGLNYSLPGGGGSVAEFKGGLGGNVLIGYAFKSHRRTRFGPQVELGYNYLSVEATTLYDPWEDSYHCPAYGLHDSYGYRTIKTTENFGGPFLRVGFRF
jgi:hypothetical protein